MELSRRADYSLRVMLEVAMNLKDGVSTTREIGQNQDIPRAFLTKIVARLTQAGLLRSFRGAAGGVTLARPAAKINMREIIEAVEGPILLNRCLDDRHECSVSSICPVRDVWCQAQQELARILQDTTLQVLVNRREIQEVSGGSDPHSSG